MPQPVVLTIAGFDPSSGAGITADIKTLAAHGCYGVACITALTVQSTVGVKRVVPVAPDLVAQTLAELSADLPLAAIKIGMLGSAEVTEAVAAFLRSNPAPNVVLDPVLKSSSGADLVDRAAIPTVLASLLPLCTVITPNLDEAAVLAGMPVHDEPDMRAAAARLHALGARIVVVTGGHLDPPNDLLSFAGGQVEVMVGERIESRSTHGTGCAFSTALAANLALGHDPRQAVRRAKQYVAQAIRTAEPMGRGTGPCV